VSAARHALVACLGVALACAKPEGGTRSGPRLTVRWTGADTAAFGASATAERCDTLHLIEIRAVSGDTGVGLALYDSSNHLIGGIGVSGDSSCADHVIAWKLRHVLNLDHVPGGVNTDPTHLDNIIYDIDQPGSSRAIAPASASGWGHPHCLPSDVVPSSLPPAP